MAVTQKEVLARMPADMRSEAEALAHQLIEDELTLRDLRSVQQLTQQHVAELLGIEQDSVSRMERRADMLLSTMSTYVEAMGGRLRLVAEFPNRRPCTIRLADLAGSSSRPRRKPPAKAAGRRRAAKSAI